MGKYQGVTRELKAIALGSRRYLQKCFSDWNDDKYNRLLDAAVAHYGYSREEIRLTLDPRIFVLIELAERYRKMVEEDT